ncbi:MAG: AAA family ATPase [Pseudomonadota bacterium]
MYNQFFGLTENPFSIAPNPRFLYMSDRHKEALAHLLYGVSEGGGFVMLTGEVGTGKTTICRCLLEQLPEHCELAFILNPKLTSLELLASVCDDLEVAYPKDSTSVKLLMDALSRHLIKKHEENKRIVLMIDEAQNLEAEVLEQIRLLTNLETNTQKLLQIILIGQPELKELLSKRILRQLAQRITARYHLEPLSEDETHDYVQHRLSVAGQDTNVFTSKSIRLLHHISGGIPRLINSICDRAMLGAYVQNKRAVEPAFIKKAAKEVLGDQAKQLITSAPKNKARQIADNDDSDDEGRKFSLPFIISMTSLATLMVVAGILWKTGLVNIESAFPTHGDTAPVTHDPATTSQLTQTASEEPLLLEQPSDTTEVFIEASTREDGKEQANQPSDEPALEIQENREPNLNNGDMAMSSSQETSVDNASDSDRVQSVEAQTLTTREPDVSLDMSLANIAKTLWGKQSWDRTSHNTMQNLFQIWGVEYKALEHGMPCKFARTQGLRCDYGYGDWDKLMTLNRPAVLKFIAKNRGQFYGLLESVERVNDNVKVTLRLGQEKVVLSQEVMNELWSGGYTLLWQVPPHYSSPIGRKSAGKIVTWISEKLAAIAGEDTYDAVDRYDTALGERIKSFQKNHLLLPDGVAGAHTMIIINNYVNQEIPRLYHGTQAQWFAQRGNP